MLIEAQSLWGEPFVAPETITAEDLLRMATDEARYELFEGVLIEEAMTAPHHGGIANRLGMTLGNYVYAQGPGFAHAIVQNTLFDLTPEGTSPPKKTILAPDVAIMRHKDEPLHVPQEAPWLAIEVISESQTLAQLVRKAQKYLATGVAEVWLVDCHTRTIEVWNVQGKTTLSDSQSLTSNLLPGFNVAISFLLDG